MNDSSIERKGSMLLKVESFNVPKTGDRVGEKSIEWKQKQPPKLGFLPIFSRIFRQVVKSMKDGGLNVWNFNTARGDEIPLHKKSPIVITTESNSCRKIGGIFT